MHPTSPGMKLCPKCLFSEIPGMIDVSESCDFTEMRECPVCKGDCEIEMTPEEIKAQTKTDKL